MKLINLILAPDLLLEFSEKVINQLIDKFTKERGPNPTIIRAYIQRFKQIQSKVDQPDPFRYSWKEFERVVDANHTSKVKTGRFDPKAEDANKIYDKDGIRVFRGESQQACVKYGQGYSWCISARSEDNMYSSYREGSNFPYFIFNDNITSEKDDQNQFIDPSHAIVVFADFSPTNDNEIEYTITNAENKKDVFYDSIEDVQKAYPWINFEITKLLVPVPLSKEEKLAKQIDYEFAKSYHDLTLKVLEKYEKYVHYDVLDTSINVFKKINNHKKFFDILKQGKFLLCKGTGKYYSNIPKQATPEQIDNIKNSKNPLPYLSVDYTLTGDVDKMIADAKEKLRQFTNQDEKSDYFVLVEDYNIEILDPLKDKKLFNAIVSFTAGYQILLNRKNSALNKFKMGIE